MRSSEKFQNAPAAIFYDNEVDALAAPLQRTLVGKFNRMPRFEQPFKHPETAPNNDSKLVPNNNPKPATEGVKKKEWVEVRHKKIAPKHVDNNESES
uniref:Uncharacterized protein n=1 Tax=Salix viminalis TaxID=40686 RepID=A0A6N2MN15_SALVM